MKYCIQGNLIIFTISGICGGKDESAKPCCQRDSDDYRKLRMSVMKSKRDNLITAIVSENPAGSSRKAAQGEGWSGLALKNSGVFDKIPKGITLLGLPQRKSAAKPRCQRSCAH
jgi:hypothetical protein